jgi:hypothetical protein
MMVRGIKKFTTHLFFTCCLMVVAGQVSAYYPPYGYQPPGSHPPQYPVNPGTAQPQSYWYQYQQPQVRQETRQPPRVETIVSDRRPYEQQSLVYRVRVIDRGSLRVSAPEIPQSSDVVLRAIGEAVTENDRQDGSREVVTEYRYLLMPLSSGNIEVPAIRVTGRFIDSNGREGAAFDVSGNAIAMDVRPATDAVQPWLPLYNLQITARLRGSEAPAAGNPIIMEVETRAVGATGSQIPSVASYLESEDFSIYPGDSSSEGSVSSDGGALEGRRVETFTLVPRYGGWLHLPAIKLNWWNVRHNRPEVAALITDPIDVMGPANPGRDGSDASTLKIPAYLWLPMGAAVGIMLFGWLSAFMGDGSVPGTESIRNLFRSVLGKLYPPVVAFANRVSPRRSFHRLRTWTGRQLPTSWKLWFCLRAVEREDDPAEWAQALQILAAKHLGVRPQAHLRQLGEGIVRCHPGANAVQVDRLLGELDEAVYGGRPVRSFPSWKREFKRQIKPGLFSVRLRKPGNSSRTANRLPGLNPQ